MKPVLFKNGKPVFTTALPTFGDTADCCCTEGGGGGGDCCCLTQYTHGMDPPDIFNVEVTGAIAGVGTIELVADAGAGNCLRWSGTIFLTDICGDILFLTVSIYCPIGKTLCSDIRADFVAGSATCAILEGGGAVPDAGCSCSPLLLVFTLHTLVVIPPGCDPCGGGGQVITVTITFP